MKETITNKTPDSVCFLMHISFDNTHRLLRNCYYFEYRGLQFKLIQNNPRKFPDSLLTIIPMNEEPATEKAFSVAAEFLSALAWRNDAEIALWYSGGSSFRNVSLKTAKPTIYSLSKIAHRGNSRGYDLGIIPHIQNESQRIALALFREANASNNDYLSFLFFWQVLEVAGTEPIGFINRTYRTDRSKLALDSETITKLPLTSQSLGNYLYDDCRNAIAHIRRKPGKTNLDIDRPSERLRLTRGVIVIKKFAEYYIREYLNLKEDLFLCSRNTRDIPRYIDSATHTYSSYRYLHIGKDRLKRNLFR